MKAASLLASLADNERAAAAVMRERERRQREPRQRVDIVMCEWLGDALAETLTSEAKEVQNIGMK